MKMYPSTYSGAKIFVFTLISMAAITLFLVWLFCFKMISPGYVGVVVDLFGDSKGVESKELHVGMHWIAPWKTVYQFPVFEQNYTWEGNSDAFHFQTSEGLAVTAEVGITYHLRPDAIPVIFAKYRRGMSEITDTFVRNNIRDAINKSASKMKIEDLYGIGKEGFFDEVEKHVRTDLQPIGIEISRIYLIGRFHFPSNVVDALNKKIEATQRAQQRENELREAEAEANKVVAKADGASRCSIIEAEAEAKCYMLRAQAEADAKYINAESEARGNKAVAESITPTLIEYEKVKHWNGALPQWTGQATPFIQVK